MTFELKILLLFSTVMLTVMYFGSGNLTYEEAWSRAEADHSSLSAEQRIGLKAKQVRFTAQAIPACLDSAGDVPDNFTVIVEMGTDGEVVRSWRQGESPFVICIQRLMTEYFAYRGMEGRFFYIFEYPDAP